MSAAVAIELDPQARASFDAQGLMTHIGAELVEAADGRCVIELAMGDHLTQQNGFFHGGVLASVADAACGHAAFTLAPEGANILSIEFKLNIVAPARGDRLRAEASVIRQGRSISTVSARIEVREAGSWTHCGEMLATMFVKGGSETR